jgi:tetratricopeptide (TPR) repeat protein
MSPKSYLLRCVIITTVFLTGRHLEAQVQIWEDTLVLPTYEPKAPDKNPMFYVPDAYQGAKRVIYPYPLMDNLSSEKSDREHRAVFLENEYIRLCLLPDMGGRLFYATDKTNDYEIFYRQHVIKPANIGMLGAWISGGIEWCVFHHHRASTHLPVDYRLVDNDDGSKTLWFGEIEPRHRMKWSIGLTLHPGRNCIETDVRMFNRTEHTHSILYWANVATHVNEDYQVIFPPSVHTGTYHAKNSFIHWPISDEIYNGKDYTGGIDVSWWKNHPDPISIFAHDLQEDFMGGYDHGKDAGTVHVGNHHVVKGAKLWEWGPGEYGSMWDCEILTDSDGPYAELMVGGFSDNQPDYSWIRPGETKHLKQYWYPVRNLGGIKNANLEAAVNIELLERGMLKVAFNTTRRQPQCRMLLLKGDSLLHEARIDLGPDQPFSTELQLEEGTTLTQLEVRLLDSGNHELIAYREKDREYVSELPETVKPPGSPRDIEQVEELVLTGQRIMQFHSPAYDPADYFREAIQRDALNVMANLHLGNLAAKDGRLEEAAGYYRKSIRRITADYTRPRDCEALYRLGVVLKKQKKWDDAVDTLYRATWDQAYYATAHFELAGISMLQGKPEEALDHLNRSLSMNSLNPEAHALKSALLRHLGQRENAALSARRARMLDPLDHMAAFELMKTGTVPPGEFRLLLNHHRENYLELASDYFNNGLYREAAEVVELALKSDQPSLRSYPILHYYAAWLHEKLGDQNLASNYYASAAAASTDYAFPFRFETLEILKAALQSHPEDSRAWYYMGNILYDHQPDQAIECWKEAVRIEPDLAIAYRNLGWGFYRWKEDPAGAIAYYEKALEIQQNDPRRIYELDVLYEMNNQALEHRLQLFTSNPGVVRERNDSYLREIEVLLLNGKYDTAISRLTDHTFLRQEGVVRLHDYFVDAHLLKGKELLDKGQAGEALEHFLLADTYPANQNIGRISNYRKEAQIYYFTGLAWLAKEDESKASTYFQKALEVPVDGSEYLYYRALAQQELGDPEEARKSATQLLNLGKEALEKAGETDFFAKFGERARRDQRQAEAHYLMALGYAAEGQREKAQKAFGDALSLHNSLLWGHILKADAP